MAQYGDQYGHVQNQEVDIQKAHDKTGVNMAEPGIVTHDRATNGLSSGQQPQQQQENLRRSGSSSSSSSEDEGKGGTKEKKGPTKKIMEKIPGVGPKTQQSHDTTSATATTMPGGEGGNSEEKKGLVDKIKEKLPGHN